MLTPSNRYPLLVPRSGRARRQSRRSWVRSIGSGESARMSTHLVLFFEGEEATGPSERHCPDYSVSGPRFPGRFTATKSAGVRIHR